MRSLEINKCVCRYVCVHISVCVCVCVCVYVCVYNPVIQGRTFSMFSLVHMFPCRGVWHLHPTTLNEAVDASGKQDLISLVYLQNKMVGVGT